jgi:hypothetical protein
MAHPEIDVVAPGGTVYSLGVQPGVPIQSTIRKVFGADEKFVTRTSLAQTALFAPSTCAASAGRRISAP